MSSSNENLSLTCINQAPFTKDTLTKPLQIHRYLFGALFGLLAVFAVYFFYRLIRMKTRPMIITINILLIILATMRLLYLIIDPYNVLKLIPYWLVQCLEDMAIPCLTSSFAIVQFALFKLCQVRLVSQRLQKPVFLAGIVVTHFLIVLVLDLLLIKHVIGCWALLLCQGFTLTWGFFLSLTVSLVALKLLKSNRLVKRTLREGSSSSRRQKGSTATVNEQIPSAGVMQSERASNGDPDLLTNTSRDANCSPLPANQLQGDVITETQPNSSAVIAGGQSVYEISLQSVNPNLDAERHNIASNQPGNHIKPVTEQKPIVKRKDHLRKVKRICLSASVTGFLCFSASLISLTIFVNPFSDVDVSQTQWLYFQSFQRTIELTFGSILLYISWQERDPSRMMRSGR